VYHSTLGWRAIKKKKISTASSGSNTPAFAGVFNLASRRRVEHPRLHRVLEVAALDALHARVHHHFRRVSS